MAGFLFFFFSRFVLVLKLKVVLERAFAADYVFVAFFVHDLVENVAALLEDLAAQHADQHLLTSLSKLPAPGRRLYILPLFLPYGVAESAKLAAEAEISAVAGDGEPSVLQVQHAFAVQQ